MAGDGMKWGQINVGVNVTNIVKKDNRMGEKGMNGKWKTQRMDRLIREYYLRSNIQGEEIIVSPS